MDGVKEGSRVLVSTRLSSVGDVWDIRTVVVRSTRYLFEYLRPEERGLFICVCVVCS